MTDAQKILGKINKADTIALFGHVSPDFDAVMSVKTMQLYLEALGKRVEVFADGQISDAIAKVLGKGCTISRGRKKFDEFDLLISLDTANLGRLGKYQKAFASHRNTIKIDHHSYGRSMSPLEYVKGGYSSCAEVVFELLQQWHAQITPRMASLLFAGLVSDTNSFQNGSTNENSFSVAKELIALGADYKTIIQIEFTSLTLKDLALERIAYKNLTIHDKVAFTCVSEEEIKEYLPVQNFSSKISNRLNQIGQIELVCVFFEFEKGRYDGSFRSKGKINSAAIAEALGGGGHFAASGVTLDAASQKDLQDKVFAAIEANL